MLLSQPVAYGNAWLIACTVTLKLCRQQQHGQIVLPQLAEVLQACLLMMSCTPLPEQAGAARADRAAGLAEGLDGHGLLIACCVA